MASDGKKYVVYGMKAECSQGTMQNYLTTDTGHGVIYQGNPLLNANDHEPQVNLTHFGDCKSRVIYEEAKRQADEKYKADADDGFFAKAGKLIAKTAAKAVVDIQSLGCHKCELDTPLPWIFCNDEHMIDGAPALTMESQCACRYGGIIRIVQEETEVEGSETAGRELNELVEEFIDTLKNDPTNYEKLRNIAQQLSGTEKVNEIEETLFNLFKPIITPLLAFDYVGETGTPTNSDFYRTMDNYGIQRLGGFCDLYDNLQWLLGMDLDTEIVTFTPEGSNREYRLQFWKGSYANGQAFGGEIGLYYRSKELAELLPYNDGNMLAYYICLEQSEEIRTKQQICDKKTGETLIENDTADYTDDEKHFWNLAIRTDYGYTADDIYIIETIYIEDEAMYDALLKALCDKDGLEVQKQDREKKIIVIRF